MVVQVKYFCAILTELQTQELVKDAVLMSVFIAVAYIGQTISLQTIEAGKVRSAYMLLIVLLKGT